MIGNIVRTLAQASAAAVFLASHACSTGGPEQGRIAIATDATPPAAVRQDDGPPRTVGEEAPSSPPPAAPAQRTLALMPLGAVPEEDVTLAVEAIEQIYGWKVDLMESRDLLASAYFKPRKRYRAEKLLAWLGGRKPADADMIMGLTAVDISTTKGKHEDWGICGLADMGGPASVVSTFRIGRKLPGEGKSGKRESYRKRLRELVAHEFGHQLGLEHCPNKGCIMEDAKGTVTTFNHSTGEICAECWRKLEEAGWDSNR